MLFVNFIIVGFGGAVGAMGRFGFGLVVTRLLGWQAFWATLSVNLIGSFLIGIAFALLYEPKTDAMQYPLSPLLIIGVLGGFTTFSTFSLELVQMVEAGRFSLAGLYMGLSVIGGLVAAYLGYSVLR